MSRPLGQLGLLRWHSSHILVQHARAQFFSSGIDSVLLQHVHVCYSSEHHAWLYHAYSQVPRGQASLKSDVLLMVSCYGPSSHRTPGSWEIILLKACTSFWQELLLYTQIAAVIVSKVLLKSIKVMIAGRFLFWTPLRILVRAKTCLTVIHWGLSSSSSKGGSVGLVDEVQYDVVTWNIPQHLWTHSILAAALASLQRCLCIHILCLWTIINRVVCENLANFLIFAKDRWGVCRGDSGNCTRLQHASHFPPLIYLCRSSARNLNLL